MVHTAGRCCCSVSLLAACQLEDSGASLPVFSTSKVPLTYWALCTRVRVVEHGFLMSKDCYCVCRCPRCCACLELMALVAQQVTRSGRQQHWDVQTMDITRSRVHMLHVHLGRMNHASRTAVSHRQQSNRHLLQQLFQKHRSQQTNDHHLRILNHLKSNLPSLKGRRAPCIKMASTKGGANAQKSNMLHMLVTMRNLLSASCDHKKVLC